MIKWSSELHLMGNTLIDREINLAGDGKNLYQNNLDAAKYLSPSLKILSDFHVNLTLPPSTGERLSTVQLRREEL